MVVFVDISDIQDEAATYKELENGSITGIASVYELFGVKKSRIVIVKDFLKKHFYLFTTAYKGLKN